MAKWIDRKEVDRIRGVVVYNACPGKIFKNDLTLDFSSKRVDYSNAKILGCRGITCAECWNQESEEE